MPRRFRLILSLLVATAAALSLAACSSINEKVGAGMGDMIPQWAGGLPANAPPRPGTAEYDRFMQERERLRQMPAAERDKETQSGATGQSTTPSR